MTRTILWVALGISLIFFYIQGSKFDHAGTADIEDYEYASAFHAHEILASWEQADLLQTVKSTIRFDFFFIVVYLMLMIGCSNDQLTREWNLPINSLLRLNISLAPLVALLDVSENLLLLHNISSSNDHISSYWVTLIKFTLAYWIVALWIVSGLKTTFSTGPKRKAPQISN